MSNLPNSAIRLVTPSFRDGYCPESWTYFAKDIVAGTSAQPNLRKGTTFYNFGSTSPYPPAPSPSIPCVNCQIQVDCSAMNASVATGQYGSSFTGTPTVIDVQVDFAGVNIIIATS